MIRSAALLQHLQTHMALIRAARLTVLPEQRGRLTCGSWHCFEIGHYVDGGIASLIGARGLRLTHSVPLPLVCCSIASIWLSSRQAGCAWETLVDEGKISR